MTVLLNNTISPLNDVALLGSNPLKVYTVLFESAQNDIRQNCGGTSSWSIKGLAAELKIKRETVSRALDKILDSGHIQIAGEITNKGGSNNTLWRVTHPNMLDAVRYSIEIMGKLPSEMVKGDANKGQTNLYAYIYVPHSWAPPRDLLVSLDYLSTSPTNGCQLLLNYSVTLSWFVCTQNER